MGIPEISIPLYHTDAKSRNEKFVLGAFFPSKEDSEWCGAGMYFWDNLSNAHYWEDKKKKRSLGDVNISSALLQCSKDDILDLTSVRNSQLLNVFARYYAQKFKVNIDFSKNGAVINFVHDAYSLDHDGTFSVVKVSGIYGGPYSGVIGKNDRGYRPHATERVKIIYAVRETRLVNNRAIVDPTKEEIPNEFSF